MLYHVCPFGFSCVYGCSDEGGENRDGEDGNEIIRGGEIMEIVWSLVVQMTWFYVEIVWSLVMWMTWFYVASQKT